MQRGGEKEEKAELNAVIGAQSGFIWDGDGERGKCKKCRKTWKWVYNNREE